ncbi:aryl-alcohol dehydrogenase-like predicted oxidoreductase [Kitasatospora sp. MAP12-15]|uniref:aldo/keto reductase n=1 Tax=unclassified Kitasatospora TaxID=2633591 RepID=UPI002474C26D|nr:aldo/keto reductase [Kitasatospora sp. MAP12-44]MDH6113589.1 aryl-alcohol dehydrogenase-like predicted oxidoreductase [Kitasatospora sp. MAP12-44]
MTIRSVCDSFVLGTWGLSGSGSLPVTQSYGRVSELSASQVLDRAWELGMRTVDTAPGYGGGDGLRRLAAWQRSRGRTWNIAAKPGRPRINGVPTNRIGPTELLAEVAVGARLVGEPRFVLVKDPSPQSYQDGSLVEALDLLEETLPGVTVGVAGHLHASLLRLPPPPRRRVAQIELNGVNRHVSVPAGEALAGIGWEVWAMQPLAYGFLARPDDDPGTRSQEDWRSLLPSATRTGLRAAADAFIRSAGAGEGQADRAATAIAFCLSIPAVSRVLVGPKTPQQLDAVMAALDLLSDRQRAHELHALAPHASPSDDCPRCAEHTGPNPDDPKSP